MIGPKLRWSAVLFLAVGVGASEAQIVLTRATFNSGTGVSEDARMRVASVLGECAVGAVANESVRGTFGFWILAGTMGAGPGGAALDAAFVLAKAAPNPFRSETRLQFELPRSGPARLAIYDLSGRLVRTLLDDEMPAGRFDASWNGRDEEGRKVAAGVHLYRLDARSARRAAHRLE
ncbi:MAG: FlgD immunoglobulin-like domain containing protein [Candidatus Eisenbacteria bacterium]